MRAYLLPVTALWVCLSLDAFALSCAPRSLTFYYKAADSVVVAELVQTDVVNSRDGNRAALRKKFKVLEVFKGDSGPEIKLIDDSIYTRVDVPLNTGPKRRELLFIKAGDNLGTCGGSQALAEDHDGRAVEERMLKQLRKLKAAQPQ